MNIKMLISKSFDSIYTNMSNFYQLEVVGRSSETQLEVGIKINFIIRHLG